jgi:hypothetical protein
MIVAKWRQHRDWSNEAALFDLEMDRQTKQLDAKYEKIDHAYRYALAFRALADESKAIQLFTRYEAAHRRSYYKALATLLQLRAAQFPPAPAPVELSTKTEVETPATTHEQKPAPSNLCEANPANTEPQTSNPLQPVSQTQINGENTPPLDDLNDKR